MLLLIVQFNARTHSSIHHFPVHYLLCLLACQACVRAGVLACLRSEASTTLRYKYLSTPKVSEQLPRSAHTCSETSFILSVAWSFLPSSFLALANIVSLFVSCFFFLLPQARFELILLVASIARVASFSMFYYHNLFIYRFFPVCLSSRGAGFISIFIFVFLFSHIS